MRPLLDRVRAGETLLADGALGSLLMERGLAPGEPPERFCLDRPEVLEEIARAYLAAGAEILQADSFGASPLKLARHGIEGSAAEINRAAVEIVRRVAGDRAYVWASIGPSGRLLKPYGDANPGIVYESFLAQARALAEASPNLIAVETMTDLAEAVLAVRAAREAGPGIPVVATMTFERHRKGFFTVMGNTIPEAAKGLAEAGADMVGSNCGNGIEAMAAIAREFRAATSLPLVIRPNAGLPELRGDATLYTETPDFMAARLPELLDLRPAIVGGCCGTTPGHIRAFRAVLDARGGTGA
jgi:5-methyltetrahydrofolate--homocysteine methyltransferase